MSLLISHCVPSDAPGYAEAFLSTYERMPRHIVTMGSISRERQLAILTASFRTGIQSHDHPTPNKEYHCLRVTDPVTNEIVAFAIWIYWPNGYKMEEDSFANVQEVPEGANEKLMRDFGRMTGELRGDHEGRKGPHWCKSSSSLSQSPLGQVSWYTAAQWTERCDGISALPARYPPKARAQGGWSHAHPMGTRSGRQRPKKVLCRFQQSRIPFVQALWIPGRCGRDQC